MAQITTESFYEELASEHDVGRRVVMLSAYLEGSDVVQTSPSGLEYLMTLVIGSERKEPVVEALGQLKDSISAHASDNNCLNARGVQLGLSRIREQYGF